MRVLMFGWEFPPLNSGGLGVACQGLSRALSEKNVDITFVLPRKTPHEEKFTFIFADNVSVTMQYIDSLLDGYITSDRYGTLNISKGDALYGPTLFDEVMRYALRAREIAQKEQFDLIHAHDWLSFPAGLAAKDVSGKPLVVHVHATEFDRTGGGSVNKKVYEVEKQGLHKSDHAIAVSQFTKNVIHNEYGISNNKVTVVHNGISANEYKESGDLDEGLMHLKRFGNKIVLFVGRITLQKGPDYFMYAAKKVLSYAPNTIFVVAGSGDMEGKMMEMAGWLGISDKVIFAGFLRGEALEKVYRVADLFVMPSVSEPFGITPLESLVHKTPVIISKQSGVSEVITHALKVDFWDVDEMADQILSVVSYDQLRSVMGENGQKEVKNLTWDSAAQKCIDVYKRLI